MPRNQTDAPSGEDHERGWEDSTHTCDHDPAWPDTGHRPSMARPQPHEAVNMHANLQSHSVKEACLRLPSHATPRMKELCR